jgi:hypothetical protein
LIGSTVEVELDDFEARWVQHSSTDVDLCAMPVAPLFNEAASKGKTIFYSHFHPGQLVTEAQLQDLDQIEDVT